MSKHVNRHMKRTFAIVLLVLSLSSINGQINRIENEIIDCIHSSMGDNGEILKQLIKSHHNLLISEGIVKDSTPESLQNSFREMAKGELIKMPSKFFVQQWNEIMGPDKTELNDCQNEILKNSGNYDSTKLINFSKELTKILIRKGLERKEVASLLGGVLGAEDFALEYYKLSTFFVFDIIPTSAGVDYSTTILKNPTQDQKSRALNLAINHESKIIYDNKPVNLEELGILLKEYFKKNKTASIIALNTSKKAKYTIYLDVSRLITQEINVLRQELAELEFQKPFGLLNQKEMDFVNTTYPLIVIE